MAKLIQSPTGGGPVGRFEPEVVQALLKGLPDSYAVIPNFSLKQRGHSALEYDVVVLAPHAIYVVEAKEWYGRLTGDDTEWLINKKPKKCPMWLLDMKCKVFKSELGAIGGQVWVDPVLVIPNGTKNHIGGNWYRNVQSLTGSLTFLQDKRRIKRSNDISQYHEQIIGALQGKWGQRTRAEKRRLAGYEIIETLFTDDDGGEFIAKRTLIAEDPTRYRIRTWRVDPYASDDDRSKRLAIVQRPTEALAKIGRHPNLLPVLQFEFDENTNEFFEVTEWSDFGTLHGYLENEARDRLTLRERLEIAAGVASALEAVHRQTLVHRNLCPQTIMIGFDRQPRLTDFDRAYIDSQFTVFPDTARRGNEAYLAPELEDKTDYDFDTCSDMYSFGVLLYRLLTDEVPFPNPKTARSAKGRPDKSPSEFRDELEPELDQLVVALLKTEDFQSRPTAAQALAVLKSALSGSSAQSRDDIDTENASVPTNVVEVGAIINNYRFDQELGRGAFSRVYKVYHLDQGRTFAMKLLKDIKDTDALLHEFNNIRPRIPNHPNIARMEWMDRLPPPDNTPYILSEFIDGEELTPYCNGEKTLAWRDIREIGLQLLSALDAIHPPNDRLAEFKQKVSNSTVKPEVLEEYQELQEAVKCGILHRDIKPANILLELPSHRAKLIDFNISSQLGEASGRGGTPRYWAPDRGQPDWRPDMDLFSLGLVLCELVTHCHAFPDDNPESGDPYDPRILRKDLNLSEELATFLLKSVQPSGADRFHSAKEMADTFQAIRSMNAPIAPEAQGSVTSQTSDAGLTLSNEEKGRSNYNPYVERLLTLYSQASRTNTGTRGLDDIGKLTYIKTKLDVELAPRIADGEFRLVIVTGNAGDGKTAFLQQVETLFQSKKGTNVEPLDSGNGSQWQHGGLSYETNYDGSQDEGETGSDQVLAKFLSPLSGSSLDGEGGKHVRLIAINEGRLLDFLLHSSQKSDYSGLRQFVHKALDGEQIVEGACLLVNLNLRSVAAGGRDSLVEKQLSKLVESQFWASCDACALHTRCPLKHNADSLRDTASGREVISRVRRLYEVVHLRRRAHVTMRDLRSSLSWLLLRDHSCADIAKLLSEEEQTSSTRVAELYYPNAFAGRRDESVSTVDDRLVALLRQADVGLVNAPQRDSRLDHDPPMALPWMTFESRSDHAWKVMKKMVRDVPRLAQDVSLGALMAQRRQLLQQWRRWAYYERRDNKWEEMIPYSSLPILESSIRAAAEGTQDALDDLRDRVIEAVTLSEGLRANKLRKDYLALGVTRVKAPTIHSYRLFPNSEFSIVLPEERTAGEFIEYAPDTVDLLAAAHLGTARLRISLDLLEMLELIRSGYRPNPTELQGLFVNLRIFRNELLNLSFKKIVITPDERDLYEVSGSVDSTGAILLKLGKFHSELEVER